MWTFEGFKTGYRKTNGRDVFCAADLRTWTHGSLPNRLLKPGHVSGCGCVLEALATGVAPLQASSCHHSICATSTLLHRMTLQASRQMHAAGGLGVSSQKSPETLYDMSYNHMSAFEILRYLPSYNAP
jgi:hypothetical protein